jgi:hypothetical protein
METRSKDTLGLSKAPISSPKPFPTGKCLEHFLYPLHPQALSRFYDITILTSRGFPALPIEPDLIQKLREA